MFPPVNCPISADDRQGRGQRNVWPWLVMVATVAVAVCQLRQQGRVWWCACGRAVPWSGDVWSSHNSQHLFDPYSFTHLLHGVVLFGLLAWAWPRLPAVWRLCLAIAIEATWEVFENTDFTIQRYRMLTIAMDYQGDTIANSLGDILSCGIGWELARRLGFWGSLGLWVGVEMVLLVWIGDNLLLDMTRLILAG
jgi:uncharacterized membrane protein YhhN